MHPGAVPSAPRYNFAVTRTSMLVSLLACVSIGCGPEASVRPSQEAQVRRPTAAMSGANPSATTNAGRRVVLTGRRTVKFTDKKDFANGEIALTILEARLRSALASGNTRGWQARARNSDGREIEVSAEQLLALLERRLAQKRAALVRPAAFQGDTGVVNINGMSQAPANSGGFDFYTTSIAGTSNPARKYLSSVFHDATRRVLLTNGAEVYRRQSTSTAQLDEAASYEVETTIWGGVSVGSGCGYDGVIGADHRLTYMYMASLVTMYPVTLTTASAGSDELRRACLPPPRRRKAHATTPRHVTSAVAGRQAPVPFRARSSSFLISIIATAASRPFAWSRIGTHRAPACTTIPLLIIAGPNRYRLTERPRLVAGAFNR
jgi:hypothetical protein